jgi:hypothetical protein
MQRAAAEGAGRRVRRAGEEAPVDLAPTGADNPEGGYGGQPARGGLGAGGAGWERHAGGGAGGEARLRRELSQQTLARRGGGGGLPRGGGAARERRGAARRGGGHARDGARTRRRVLF